MSRHLIAALQPQYTCVVGYDPPLGTFFAQVWDQTLPATEEQVVLWVGTTLHEIPTVQALATDLRKYAVIPAESPGSSRKPPSFTRATFRSGWPLTITAGSEKKSSGALNPCRLNSWR